MLIHHHPNIGLFVEAEYQMKMNIFYLQHTGISEKSQLQYLIWEFLQSKVSKHSKITYFVFLWYSRIFWGLCKPEKYCFSLLLVEKRFCPVLILLAGKMFLWYPFDFIVESNLCGHKTGFKRMSRWKNIDFGEQPPNKNRCWWLLICLSLQLYIQSGKENYRGVLWKFLCTFQWVLRQNLSWCWRKDLQMSGCSSLREGPFRKLFLDVQKIIHIGLWTRPRFYKYTAVH